MKHSSCWTGFEVKVSSETYNRAHSRRLSLQMPCQGDFIEALMDNVGPELAKPAREISEFALNGSLDAALRGSSAQYDAADQINRLRIKLETSQLNDEGTSVTSTSHCGRVLVCTKDCIARRRQGKARYNGIRVHHLCCPTFTAQFHKPEKRQNLGSEEARAVLHSQPPGKA